ncbi:hypothetical protein N0V90_005866 [Kalmusia sp. IMI 367209]|nr:hypothetical protein N0V90_005866 [Kalmusia sp. IMI 367209]
MARHSFMSEPSPLRDPHSNRTSEPKDYNILTPLHPDGSDFACKLYQYNTPLTSVATYEAGQTYQMKLMGGATHGGGSCQVSLSCDLGQHFNVIKSIEGNCPIQKEYEFTIPEDAQTANQCLLAWTWFNKIGNREMYMNCAVVDIVGASSSARKIAGHSGAAGASTVDTSNAAAQAVLARYPKLFVANLKGVNDCTTKETVDVVFDDPGTDVEYGDGIGASSRVRRRRSTGACTGTGRLTAGKDSSAGTDSSSSSDSSSSGGSTGGNDGQWHSDQSSQDSSSSGSSNPDQGSQSSSSYSSSGGSSGGDDGQYHPGLSSSQGSASSGTSGGFDDGQYHPGLKSLGSSSQGSANQGSSSSGSSSGGDDGQYHPDLSSKSSSSSGGSDSKSSSPASDKDANTEIEAELRKYLSTLGKDSSKATSDDQEDASTPNKNTLSISLKHKAASGKFYDLSKSNSDSSAEADSGLYAYGTDRGSNAKFRNQLSTRGAQNDEPTSLPDAEGSEEDGDSDSSDNGTVPDSGRLDPDTSPIEPDDESSDSLPAGLKHALADLDNTDPDDPDDDALQGLSDEPDNYDRLKVAPKPKKHKAESSSKHVKHKTKSATEHSKQKTKHHSTLATHKRTHKSSSAPSNDTAWTEAVSSSDDVTSWAEAASTPGDATVWAEAVSTSSEFAAWTPVASTPVVEVVVEKETPAVLSVFSWPESDSASPSTPIPDVTEPVSAFSPPAPAPTDEPSLSSSCTPGTFFCKSSDQFYVCGQFGGSNEWTYGALRDVSKGMACQGGVIARRTAKAKRGFGWLINAETNDGTASTTDMNPLDPILNILDVLIDGVAQLADDDSSSHNSDHQRSWLVELKLLKRRLGWWISGSSESSTPTNPLDTITVKIDTLSKSLDQVLASHTSDKDKSRKRSMGWFLSFTGSSDTSNEGNSEPDPLQDILAKVDSLTVKFESLQSVFADGDKTETKRGQSFLGLGSDALNKAIPQGTPDDPFAPILEKLKGYENILHKILSSHTKYMASGDEDNKDKDHLHSSKESHEEHRIGKFPWGKHPSNKRQADEDEDAELSDALDSTQEDPALVEPDSSTDSEDEDDDDTPESQIDDLTIEIDDDALSDPGEVVDDVEPSLETLLNATVPLNTTRTSPLSAVPEEPLLGEARPLERSTAQGVSAALGNQGSSAPSTDVKYAGDGTVDDAEALFGDLHGTTSDTSTGGTSVSGDGTEDDAEGLFGPKISITQDAPAPQNSIFNPLTDGGDGTEDDAESLFGRKDVNITQEAPADEPPMVDAPMLDILPLDLDPTEDIPDEDSTIPKGTDVDLVFTTEDTLMIHFTTEDGPIKKIPEIIAPIDDLPTEDGPIEEFPTVDVPLWTNSTGSIAIWSENSTADALTSDILTEATPTVVAPMRNILDIDDPSLDFPAEPSPIEVASIEDAPIEDIPTPTEAPIEAAPTQAFTTTQTASLVDTTFEDSGIFTYLPQPKREVDKRQDYGDDVVVPGFSYSDGGDGGNGIDGVEYAVADIFGQPKDDVYDGLENPNGSGGPPQPKASTPAKGTGRKKDTEEAKETDEEDDASEDEESADYAPEDSEEPKEPEEPKESKQPKEPKEPEEPEEPKETEEPKESEDSKDSEGSKKPEESKVSAKKPQQSKGPGASEKPGKPKVSTDSDKPQESEEDDEEDEEDEDEEGDEDEDEDKEEDEEEEEGDEGGNPWKPAAIRKVKREELASLGLTFSDGSNGGDGVDVDPVAVFGFNEPENYEREWGIAEQAQREKRQAPTPPARGLPTPTQHVNPADVTPIDPAAIPPGFDFSDGSNGGDGVDDDPVAVFGFDEPEDYEEEWGVDEQAQSNGTATPTVRPSANAASPSPGKSRQHQAVPPAPAPEELLANGASGPVPTAAERQQIPAPVGEASIIPIPRGSILGEAVPAPSVPVQLPGQVGKTIATPPSPKSGTIVKATPIPTVGVDIPLNDPLLPIVAGKTKPAPGFYDSPAALQAANAVPLEQDVPEAQSITGPIGKAGAGALAGVPKPSGLNVTAAPRPDEGVKSNVAGAPSTKPPPPSGGGSVDPGDGTDDAAEAMFPDLAPAGAKTVKTKPEEDDGESTAKKAPTSDDSEEPKAEPKAKEASEESEDDEPDEEDSDTDEKDPSDDADEDEEEDDDDDNEDAKEETVRPRRPSTPIITPPVVPLAPQSFPAVIPNITVVALATGAVVKLATWKDGVLMHGDSPASSAPSPLPTPNIAASILPFFMGPGPVIPSGLSLNWPGPFNLHNLPPSTTLSPVVSMTSIIEPAATPLALEAAGIPPPMGLPPSGPPAPPLPDVPPSAEPSVKRPVNKVEAVRRAVAMKEERNRREQSKKLAG